MAHGVYLSAHVFEDFHATRQLHFHFTTTVRGGNILLCNRFVKLVAFNLISYSNLLKTVTVLVKISLNCRKTSPHNPLRINSGCKRCQFRWTANSSERWRRENVCIECLRRNVCECKSVFGLLLRLLKYPVLTWTLGLLWFRYFLLLLTDLRRPMKTRHYYVFCIGLSVLMTPGTVSICMQWRRYRVS